MPQLTPEQSKGEEFFYYFHEQPFWLRKEDAKQAAIKIVDEIQKLLWDMSGKGIPTGKHEHNYEFWEQVKQQIQIL